MFRSLIASIATVFAAFAITGASFADSTTKPPSAAISPSWTGFYAGSNIGYGWTEDQSTAISSNDPATQVLILNAVPLSLNSPTLKSSGVLGGLQLGYNYQFAPNWLLGIETDLQVSDLKDRSSGAFTVLGVPFSSTAHQHVDWFGTVRGRLGFLITPDWLVYGTGGFAYGRVEQSYSIANNAKFISIGFLTAPSFICVEASVCASGSDTQTRTGWTAGGGVEWRIPNFAILNRPATVKLEYLHVNLGNKDVIVRALSNSYWREREVLSSQIKAVEDGHPLRLQGITQACDLFIRGTKRPRLRFHDLRHAHATHFGLWRLSEDRQ